MTTLEIKWIDLFLMDRHRRLAIPDLSDSSYRSTMLILS